MTLQPSRLVSINRDAPPEGAEAFCLRRDGRNIRFLIAPGGEKPRGTVLISPGRCEFIEKYFEVAREIQSRGFAVFITDHYGQGLSDRPLKDRFKGHIDSFDTYAADFEAMISAVWDRLPGPHVLMGHSMGGMVAVKMLARGRIPVRACVLSAPMLGINGLAPGASIAASAAVLLGLAARYVPGRDTDVKSPTYHGNMLTHDQARFDRMVRYYEAERALMLGAPTFGWVAAAARAIDETRRPGFAESIETPMLIASAADDSLVSNRAQERFAAHSLSAQLADMPGSRHEILMEKDEIRQRFWAAFDTLLTRAKL